MFVGDTWSSTLFDRCFGNSHMTSYAIFDLYFVTGSSLNTWHRFPHFFILWPWIITKFIKSCLFLTFLLSDFFFNVFWRCYDNDNLRDDLTSTWHDCKRPRAWFSPKNRANVNPKVNLKSKYYQYKISLKSSCYISKILIIFIGLSDCQTDQTFMGTII